MYYYSPGREQTNFKLRSPAQQNRFPGNVTPWDTKHFQDECSLASNLRNLHRLHCAGPYHSSYAGVIKCSRQ
jgi:hypothetical protein